MTEKGFIVLNSLLNSNNLELINYVVIGKDDHLTNDFSFEIENLCINNNISYDYRSDKKEYVKSDYCIAISWRWIIDVENLIVLHDSLLPKYRGFAPLVNALINGEPELGVTAIFASVEYDKGNIILQNKTSITYPIKISDAISVVSKIYSKIVIEIFNLIKSDKIITAYPQNETEASYSLWLDEDDYFIDWNDPADKIARKVDACGSPYAGAKAKLFGRDIIISDVETLNEVKIENRTVGKLIFYEKDKPIFVCGVGLLKINKGVYVDTLESILPLKKFRIRLK